MLDRELLDDTDTGLASSSMSGILFGTSSASRSPVPGMSTFCSGPRGPHIRSTRMKMSPESCFDTSALWLLDPLCSPAGRCVAAGTQELIHSRVPFVGTQFYAVQELGPTHSKMPPAWSCVAMRAQTWAHSEVSSTQMESEGQMDHQQSNFPDRQEHCRQLKSDRHSQI